MCQWGEQPLRLLDGGMRPVPLVAQDRLLITFTTHGATECHPEHMCARELTLECRPTLPVTPVILARGPAGLELFNCIDLAADQKNN
jgi:hypothetical protein